MFHLRCRWRKAKPEPEKWVYVGDSFNLIDRLKQANHPDYLKWVAAGCPRGNSGFHILASHFKFKSFRESG